MSTKGLTLVEVVISLALVSIVFFVALSSLMTTQTVVGHTTTIDTVNRLTRRAAEQMANIVRDANYDSTDIEPNTLSNYQPTAGSPFEFRRVTSYDPTNGKVVLNPTRTSTWFARLYLTGDTLFYDRDGSGSGPPIELVAGLSDVRLTLTSSTDPATLLIRVTADRKDPNDHAAPKVRAVSEVRVQLRNSVASAD